MPRQIKNTYKTEEEFAILTTYSKYGRNYKIDLDKIKQFQWYSDKNGYALCKRKNKAVRLHRLVMNYDGELTIDHINRDVTDNRKSNLRIADASTQNKNRKTPWNVEKSKAKVLINGVLYDSISEASKETGIPRTTLNDIKLNRYSSRRKYMNFDIKFEGVVAHD